MSNQVATQSDKPLTVTMGFGSLESFEFMQRTAKMFAVSSMVPTAYRETIVKGYGQNQTVEANPSAVPNAMIALNMAQRMNADPLMIMQNLHVIEGRPSWSSQFIIAAINSSGRFSPLRFDLTDGPEIDATYTTFEWENNRKVPRVTKVRVKNLSCVAWCVELATNTRLESTKVTMEMAVNEGWYGKNGSKWQSMPDLMLRYRTAAFFGRIYAPELLMGLTTAEELRDVIDIEPQADGSYAMPSAMPAVVEIVPEPVSKKAASKADAPPAEPAAQEPVAQPSIKEEKPVHHAADTAPAATKTVAQSADPATGELPAAEKISTSQAKYLENKIKALELPEPAVAAILTRFGVEALAGLDVLQFDTLKSELLAMGA